MASLAWFTVLTPRQHWLQIADASGRISVIQTSLLNSFQEFGKIAPSGNPQATTAGLISRRFSRRDNGAEVSSLGIGPNPS